MASARNKELVYVLALCAIIGFSIFRVVGYWRAPSYNVKLHRGVGQAMAEQTLAVLGRTGRVLVITLDPLKHPALKTQIDAFDRAVKRVSSVSVSKHVLTNSAGKRRFGPGVGLTSSDFVELVKRSPDANALVSFAGTPNPSDQEIQQYPGPPVKFVAETQSRGKLKKLFRQKLLSAAIVPRFNFPAPGPAEPRTAEEWFQRNYQIVTPALAESD